MLCWTYRSMIHQRWPITKNLAGMERRKIEKHWDPGGEHLADYFTKHHSSAHHKIMRSQYVHSMHVPMICYSAAAALKHTARVC
jgi:hypothetical protein